MEKLNCAACQCPTCGVRAPMIGETEALGCLHCLTNCDGPVRDCTVGPLVCPACGSEDVYFARIRPQGEPPYYCDDCGHEGEITEFGGKAHGL